MKTLVIGLLSKVYLYVLAGFLAGLIIGQRAEGLTKRVIWLILYVLIPLFIFDTIWANSISFSGAWKVVATAVFVISGGIAAVFLWAKIKGIPFKKYALSVAFMNSAFLAIPVSAFLWGRLGAQYAIIYNIVLTIVFFTLGITLADEKNSFAGIFRLPEIYAITLGFILYFLRVKPSLQLSQGLGFVSSVTLPAMLIFVGFKISKIKFRVFSDALIGVMLRIGGGWLLSLAAVTLLSIPFPERGVCIMSSAMPTAIMSYIIAEEFQADAEFAAAMIVLGSILSFFTIPLIAYLYGRN